MSLTFSMRAAILKAFAALTTDKRIREQLAKSDPELLNHTEAAMMLVTNSTVVLLLTKQEVQTTMRALSTANASPDTAREDRLPNTWVAERIYSQLPGEMRINPDPPTSHDVHDDGESKRMRWPR